MRQVPARPPWRRLLLFAAAILALTIGYQWGSRHAPSPLLALNPLPQPLPLNLPALLDRRGDPFGDAALAGRWSLLFFAHTGDPATARSLFQLATRVINRLADQPALQRQAQVVMVSADPQRDSPAVLAAFTAGYREPFRAVTGQVAAIDLLGRQLGITLARQGRPGEPGYRVDHATSLLLIDPQGRLLGRFTGLVDAASIASDLKLLAADQAP